MSGNASGAHASQAAGTRPVLVVCGPTASGKSALAADVAAAFDGEVINADSMQVYRELSILTARPGTAETARAPHRLYGIASVTDPFSAGRWRELAVAAIRDAHAAGRLPVVCGGTGLYLKALMDGLSAIPDVPPAVRAAVRAQVAATGPEAAHAALVARDPAMAARLHPSDTQRIARALEVLEATGQSLAGWQETVAETPDPDWRFATILLLPPREALHAAIAARFARMIEAGALDEVRRLDGLDPALPALKAVGVPALRRHLAGELDRETAVEYAQRATRQYAKRQETWFRYQIISDLIVQTQYSESLKEEIFSFIRNLVLTPPA